MFLVAKESEIYALYHHIKKENSGLVRLQFFKYNFNVNKKKFKTHKS